MKKDLDGTGGNFEIAPQQVVVFPDGRELPLSSGPPVQYFLDNTVPGLSKSALKPRSRSQGHVPPPDVTLTIDLQMACEKAAGLSTETQSILVGYCDRVPEFMSLNENRTVDNWRLLHSLTHPVQWNEMHGVAWPRGVSEFDTRL